MSWLFSQVLVEEFSPDTSSDGEPCAQLNVKPTPHKFWRNDKMMEFSKLSQFGLTLQLLTENRGEAVLISYLAAFPARTLAPPEKAKALPANDPAYGERWHASFAKYSHDTHSLKTAQCSLFEDSTQFCATLPRWGSMRNGVCWEQTPLAPHTNATESGYSLPTPTASDGSKGSPNQTHGGRPTLSNIAAKKQAYPTPTKSDASGGPGNHGRQGGSNLRTAVSLKLAQGPLFPTPTKSTADKEVISSQKNFNLVAYAKMFPTPIASDFKGAPNLKSVQERAKKSSRGVRLPEALQREQSGAIGGQLNPTWVEWLMGWPLGWTDLKPLETDKCPSAQPPHLNYSGSDLRTTE